MRKICFVTGSRAEYGQLYWVLREVDRDSSLSLQLVVTGAHLSERFGNTGRAIADDGFRIDAKVDIGLDGDAPEQVAAAIGRGCTGMAEAFAVLQPDAVVVTGDRFEMLPAAIAAMIARIPLIHIHGGEVTEGAVDDSIRHAITKMAQLHLVAAEPYRDRVIQMGEPPESVFTVGAPALDYIAQLEPMSRIEIEQSLGFQLGDGFLLVTYHPVTARQNSDDAAVAAMLSALDAFPERQVLITGANADSGNMAIDLTLREFAGRDTERVKLVSSLGQRRYLSAMGLSAAVVGNSSSGILEAPALGVPTVNIGPRQTGRLRAPSVIDCGETAAEIEAAIDRALDPTFRDSARRAETPIGGPGASAHIRERLKAWDLESAATKRFHDIPIAVHQESDRWRQ